jgi:CII-binding regulator of phage lambda lysogenization HflD
VSKLLNKYRTSLPALKTRYHAALTAIAACDERIDEMKRETEYTDELERKIFTEVRV